MHDTTGETGREPEEIFADLRRRPTPELDSGRLWRGVEARLTPRRPALWTRLVSLSHPGWRPVHAIAVVAVAALVAWTVFLGTRPSPPRFVLLTPTEPATSGTAPAARSTDGNELLLDVRLVRGFDGAPPQDVRSARALGVGGADALADVRSRIQALLPYADFGVVGSWNGTVTKGEALDLPLAESYRLVARSANIVDGSVLRLDGIQLVGAGGEPVSGDLALEPGRLYILGVLAREVESPELVLLLRALTTAGEEPHR